MPVVAFLHAYAEMNKTSEVRKYFAEKYEDGVRKTVCKLCQESASELFESLWMSQSCCSAGNSISHARSKIISLVVELNFLYAINLPFPQHIY